MDYLTHNETETEALGARLAGSLSRSRDFSPQPERVNTRADTSSRENRRFFMGNPPKSRSCS